MDEQITQQFLEELRNLNETLGRHAKVVNPNVTWLNEYENAGKDHVKGLKNLSKEELEHQRYALKNQKNFSQAQKELIEEQLKQETRRREISEQFRQSSLRMIGSLNNLGKAFDDITGDVTKYNAHITGLGDGALELGKKFGVAGTTIGATVKALTFLTTVSLDQADKMLKAFDSLSEVGGTSNITTAQIRELGSAAGYSVANLDKFLKPIKSLGLDIGLLGSTAAQGAQTFSKMAAVGNDTYRAFNRLGISQEELTEAQARFIKQSGNAGTQLSKSPMALQKASLEYLDTLVQLRDLHGISIKQQQDALDTAKNNDNFNTYMMQKRLQRAEIEKQMESTNDPIVKKQLEVRAAEITQLIKNKEAYATYATSTYDAAQAARLLQSISSDGAPIYTESNKELILQNRNMNDLNHTLATSKDVNAAINLDRIQNAKATKELNQNLGVLASGLGSQSTEINKTFGLSNEMRNSTIRNLEMTTEAGRKRIEEEQAEVQANIERRKKEGVIIDENGKAVRDTTKDTQNALLTVNREISKFKDSVISSINPFTGSIFGAIAGIGAFTFAAVKAAGMLQRMTGLGGLGDIFNKPGSTPTTGSPSGSSGKLGRIGGFIGRAALPILGGYMAGSQLSDIEEKEKAGEISKKEATGEKAGTVAGFGLGGAGALVGAGIGQVLIPIPGVGALIGGAIGGALGGAGGYFGGKAVGKAFSSEDTTNVVSKETSKLKTNETTTTVESGGQKAVNVNVVQSVPLTVNIDKFLDPLFKLSKLGMQSVTTEVDDITLADVNDKVTLPVKISAMSEGFETLFKSMNNHLFIIANKIESVDSRSAGTSGGGGASGSSGSTAPPPAAAPVKPAAPSGGGAGGTSPDLGSVVKAGPGVDLKGLDPAFSATLASMAKEFTAGTGKKMQVNSAARDSRKQAELFRTLGPGIAAPPGRSFHEKGLAVDMNSVDLNLADNMGLLNKYGLVRPVRGEPWHLEPKSNRGGVPDNPYAPGKAIAKTENTPAAPVAAKSAVVASPAASVAQKGAIPTTAPSVPITNPKDSKPISPFADPESEFYSPERNPDSQFYDPTMMSDTMMDDDERKAYREYLDKLNAWNEKQQGAKSNYASGGMILGPGSGTSDSVPAFNKDTGQPIALSTGEYVLPANVTSMLGRGYLDSLISSPNTLKRQKGGTIPGKGGKEIVSSNDLGEGMREVLYSDGSRTLSGGFGTRFFDSSGNLVKMTSPSFGGLTQTVYPSGKQDLDYQGEHVRVSKTSSGMLSGSYDLGIGSIGMKNVDPRYTAVGGHNKDSQFSVSMRGVDKDVVKTFTGAEIAEMLKQSQNENLVQNALGNTATIIGDPMKEVLNPYLDQQEKMLSTFAEIFGKMLSELEQSNSTQSNILAYTRN